jgi:hypothetical protein
MYDEHIIAYKSWRYYNCRVTEGPYAWDPEDPCLSLSYRVDFE